MHVKPSQNLLNGREKERGISRQTERGTYVSEKERKRGWHRQLGGVRVAFGGLGGPRERLAGLMYMYFYLRGEVLLVCLTMVMSYQLFLNFRCCINLLLYLHLIDILMIGFILIWLSAELKLGFYFFFAGYSGALVSHWWNVSLTYKMARI